MPVSLAVPHTGAVAALTPATEQAALLVVAAPPRGPLRGMFPGSIDHALMRHVVCPVLFVTPPQP